MSKIKIIICLLVVAYTLTFPVLATIPTIPIEEYVNAENIENVENVENDEDDEDVKVQKKFIPSRAMITDYFVEGGGLAAGKVSKVTFKLKNMSRTSNITSVLLIGWIDSSAPVEFTGINQAYVEIIFPSEEVEIVLEYYAKNVDMTAIGNVSAGFAIYFHDDALNGNERINNVSVKLPILHGARNTIAEEYMQWSTPSVSRLDRMLTSNIMQAMYAAGLVCCSIWILLLMFFKFGVLKRRF